MLRQTDPSTAYEREGRPRWTLERGSETSGDPSPNRDLELEEVLTTMINLPIVPVDSSFESIKDGSHCVRSVRRGGDVGPGCEAGWEWHKGRGDLSERASTRPTPPLAHYHVRLNGHGCGMSSNIQAAPRSAMFFLKLI